MAVNEHGDPATDARLARLYREAAREEPPAHLDRVIMAAAREGTQPAPVQRRSSWWTTWRLPFAFAALATVSVSLITLMYEHDPERAASVPPPSPPAVYEREQTKREQSSELPASAGAPAKDSQPRALRREDAREAGSTPRAGAAATNSRRGETGPVEAPPPLADAPLARQKAPASDAAAQSAIDGVAAAPPRAGSEAEAGRAEQRAIARSAPAPMATPAPIEPAPAGSPASVLSERPAPGPAAKPASPPARPAPASKARSGTRGLEADGYAADARPSLVGRQLAELEGKPLAAWTDRVLMLRREGRMAEADALLVELRRRFPDQPLPVELQ